jgi:hypothetical protein
MRLTGLVKINFLISFTTDANHDDIPRRMYYWSKTPLHFCSFRLHTPNHIPHTISPADRNFFLTFVYIPLIPYPTE